MTGHVKTLPGYSGSDWPSEISTLVERRQKIVQEAVNKLKISRKTKKKDTKAWAYKNRFLKFVNDVNVAFSVVKMYVEDEYEVGQKPHSTVFVAGKTNVTIPYKETGSNVLLAATLNEPNVRWQTSLMNNSVYLDDLFDDPGFLDDSAFFEEATENAQTSFGSPRERRPVQFVGVYSGYNGEAASNLCYSRFHQLLGSQFATLMTKNWSEREWSALTTEVSKNRMTKLGDNQYAKDIKKCFVDTFQQIDDFACMGEGEHSSVRWSGVSISTCLFEKIGETSFVHVANCGDNRVIACRDGEAVRLNKVHNLSHKSERDRIKEKPECLKYMRKVETTHATRGIGNLGDKILRQVVVPVPSCASYVIDDSTEFILIGSRGLFNVLTEAQCVKICKSVLPKYFVEIKRSVEEHLVSEDEEETIRNKTVTFQSPSRLQEILQSRSKNAEGDINYSPIDNEEEDIEHDDPKNDVFHVADVTGADSETNKINDTANNETSKEDSDANANEIDKSDDVEKKNDRDVISSTTRSAESPTKTVNSDDSDNINPNNNDDDESSEGSPIVSRIHTPSSTESSGSKKSPTKGFRVSNSEVFKGLSLKALRGELSNVTVDAKTDWYQYLPSMAKSICEKLCLSAMKNGCKENVTCAIVFLPAIRKRVEFDSETIW